LLWFELLSVLLQAVNVVLQIRHAARHRQNVSAKHEPDRDVCRRQKIQILHDSSPNFVLQHLSMLSIMRPSDMVTENPASEEAGYSND
jgi:hypothetical protein